MTDQSDTPLNPLSGGYLPSAQAGTVHEEDALANTPVSDISESTQESPSLSPLLRGAGGVSCDTPVTDSSQSMQKSSSQIPLLRGARGVSIDPSVTDSSQSTSESSHSQLRTPCVKNVKGLSSSSAKRQIFPYNPHLKKLARQLRNNSTKSEIILWTKLKGKFMGKYDFHRQKPLDNFIADFFCFELKLVIEIDGASHDWEETRKKNSLKETRFYVLGLNTLRVKDAEVFKRLDEVIRIITIYAEGFEKGNLSAFVYENSPLNSLIISDTTHP